MTGRLIALTLCIAVALVVKFHAPMSGSDAPDARQADGTTCDRPRLWTNPQPGAECYKVPKLCPDGSAECEIAPRLWTNSDPKRAVERL